MKYIYKIVILIAIISPCTTAQSRWTWQNPLPQGNTLFSVDFSETYVGTAVGELGTIIRTIDGGTNWSIQKSGIIQDLHSVSFTDRNYGTVVGSDGIILRTTNGGETWIPHSSGTTQTLRAVQFINTNIGIIVGDNGTILRTEDGGNTWIEQFSRTTRNLYGLAFTHADTGTVVGEEGTILRTVDGGKTWNMQVSDTDVSLRAVSFSSTNTGTAVGKAATSSWVQYAYRTTDGGDTWTSQKIADFSYFTTLYDVSFTDENNGTVVGSHGKIYRTSDGGESWHKQDSGGGAIYGISTTDDHNGVVVGESGTIFHTSNGGAIWNPQCSGETENLNSISFMNETTGTAVGEKGIILSTNDGGTTWHSQFSNSSHILNKVHLYASNIGTIVGSRSGTSTRYFVILRTTDGGINWEDRSPWLVKGILSGVFFCDENNGTAVGYDYDDMGKILITDDGGASWIQYQVPTVRLRAVFYVDQNSGLIVGDNGTIFNTTDAGLTWTPKTSNVSNHLYDVICITKNNAFAVGANGTILRTTDASETWTQQESGTGNALYSISFIDSTNGFIVGDYGTILNTIDGGENWTLEQSLTNLPIYGISYFAKNSAVAVGGNGMILHWSDGPTSAPSAPNLLSPQDGEINVPLNSALSWEPSIDATAYGLQLAIDPNFSQTLIDTNGITTDTFIINSSLNPNTLFYWRVNAENNVNKSDWSSIWRFNTISAPPLSPTLVSPSDGDTLYTFSPTFTWNVTSDALNYHLQLSSAQSFSNIVFEDSTLTTNYKHVDELASGLYYWRVRVTNSGGTSPFSEIWRFIIPNETSIMENEFKPSEFSLSQNYPNPFNPSTKIRYAIPKDEYVLIKVFDLLGKEIETLVSERKIVGEYVFQWHPENLPSGIYIYQMQAGKFIQIKKLILIK